MIRTSTKELFIVFLTLCAVSISVAQAPPTPNSTVFWMIVTESAGGSNTRFFGNHQNGTNGVDSTTLGENLQPPDPPTFNSRFMGPPLRSTAYGSEGLDKDFRGFLSASQMDTFNILVSNPEDSGQVPGYSIRIEWPSASYITARCDSAVLFYRMVFEDPEGEPIVTEWRVNMLDERSVEIVDVFNEGPGYPNNLNQRKISLIVYKWGVVLQDTGTTRSIIDHVKTESGLAPAAFALGQNYPNPFNPTTTLRFDIEAKSRAEITIYNVLGQKVTTLFTGDIAPGTYSVTWDGTNEHSVAVPSGVYFARMSAEVAGKADRHFAAVRKLVLMK